jgi:hypothetical protein
LLFSCSLSYSLIDPSGNEISKGEGLVKLEEENLSILPEFGEELFLSLRDILDISEQDYRINLVLSSKENLTLFYLGYYYEDFLRTLNRLRNNLLLKDMLVDEKIRRPDVEAEFVYFDETSQKKQDGKCGVRLYETSVVVIPEKGEFIRVPLSDISAISKQEYSLVLNTESREKLVLSRMAREFDPFTKDFSESNNELMLKVQSSLKELLPQADPLTIRRIATFMKDGKLAKRSDIEAISPELWTKLEKKLEATGIKESYDFLKTLSQEEKICIGLKRGLLGDLTGEYVWFIIPIYSTNPEMPGNAVAMEASSGEVGGMATYFFRIAGREDYRNFKSLEDLHLVFDDFIKKMNRCMININFRREPIYLPDDRLDEPQYLRYRFAMQKLPSLRILRNLFIGRVIHYSSEQWKNEVMDLLRFNVSTEDDSLSWKR